MRPCLPLLAFLLATAALPAQNAPSAHFTILTPADPVGCPVLFHARRWDDASSLKDVDARPPGASKRGLYLHSERDLSGKEVRSAMVVVHGSAPSLHLDPARPSVTGHLRQTFRLAELPRDRDGAWKLTTDRVPLIEQIEITEVYFVDGSVWHASQQAQCRFMPELYLPVASLR